MSKEVRSLLTKRSFDLDNWVIGKVPKHFKRLSVSKKKARELAEIGATLMWKHFEKKVYFSQAMIVGALLTDEFSKLVIVTPSQYGKSWLFGHAAIINAYLGNTTYIAGGSAELSNIIMQNAIAALQDASGEIKAALKNKKDQIDRLATSISKTRISFASGGSLEAISLGDAYEDKLSRNKAVGRAGDYIVDEAALVSEDTFLEMGRVDFAKLDEQKYKMAMISNPHNPGVFYDALTDDDPEDDTFILWIDALTAIEEERFTENQVLTSTFNKNRHTRIKYLLCEMDVEGDSMFETPKIYEGSYEGDYTTYFLGVDSAYKGKDNITYALNAVDEEGNCYIDEIITVDKGDWVDGVTENRICDEIAKICKKLRIPLVCADIGWGVWIVSGLNDRGVLCKGIGFGEGATKERQKVRHYAATHAKDKRAEMHLDLQNLIEDGKIAFSEQAWDKVKDIFPFVKSEVVQGDKRRIIKKSEIKAKIGRSPDELDSVLLSIHAPLIFGTIE